MTVSNILCRFWDNYFTHRIHHLKSFLNQTDSSERRFQLPDPDTKILSAPSPPTKPAEDRATTSPAATAGREKWLFRYSSPHTLRLRGKMWKNNHTSGDFQQDRILGKPSYYPLGCLASFLAPSLPCQANYSGSCCSQQWPPSFPG